MIPVFQTIVSNKEGTVHGNCMGACLASIFEIPIEDVPPFQDMGRDWFLPFFNFIYEHKYSFYGTMHDVDKILAYKIGIGGYYLVNGTSPRGFVRGHAVVYKNGLMVHDPHPDGGGVLQITSAFMIEPRRESNE